MNNNNNNWSYFSTQLSKLLIALGKSQKDLSNRTNISESKLSKLLSAKAEPRYNDILNISEALKVSPSFFFENQSLPLPSEIGYILGTRVYSVVYSNLKQDTLILMGRTLENNSFIPVKTLKFLSKMKNRTIFSITLISGEINITDPKFVISDKKLVKGVPLILDPNSEIKFIAGSSYFIQIIGSAKEFIDHMKNHLPSEKLLDF